ncbi:MAG TPA: PP2C family serine/threonine-protein phosphatase, partial [Frankiaceae bacterium]|nr:PP2C family serine/threonine-protein phosphatase [Frankiaceae bacterium]
MTLRLHYALRSDVGHVREGNEDSAYAGSRLLAVADGMGGHAAGEVASSTVIAQLAPLDEDVAGGDLLDALAAAVRQANEHLREMAAADGTLDGMGTTITAMLSAGSRLGVLHVGDSRAYLLRDGELSQVTHDHTLVQDLVDQGRITPEQATTHPQRSLLMRALDGREVEPDLSIREARRGDRYLLCTDGLSGVVSEDTILAALLLPKPQEAVDRLVELALKGGGPDNVTVVVGDVVDDHATHDDHPLVAGAAAEKRAVPGAAAVPGGSSGSDTDGGSAAAKAARIGRAPAGAEDAAAPPDAPPPRRRGRRLRWFLLAVGIAALLVGGGAAGWAYVRSQYYVGVDQQHVALFQGVEGSIVGLSLSSVRGHYMRVTDLPDFAQRQVAEGIPASSRGDAERIVAQLGEETVRPAATGVPQLVPTTRPGGPARPSACPSPPRTAAGR